MPLPANLPHSASAFIRMLERNVVPYRVVSGTTSATINTAATLAHGLQDQVGKPLVPSVVIAFPTSNTGGVYQGAAPTNTVIDIRSTVASVPYIALVLA